MGNCSKSAPLLIGHSRGCYKLRLEELPKAKSFRYNNKNQVKGIMAAANIIVVFIPCIRMSLKKESASLFQKGNSGT